MEEAKAPTQYEIVIPSKRFIIGYATYDDMVRELDYVRIVLGHKDAYCLVDGKRVEQ